MTVRVVMVTGESYDLDPSFVTADSVLDFALQEETGPLIWVRGREIGGKSSLFNLSQVVRIYET